MNEKLIEKKLRDSVQKLGGLAIKFFVMSFTGFPDRIILMPGARIYFVELKSTGKKQSARQLLVNRILKDLGFQVFIIDDQHNLEMFLNKIKMIPCQEEK